MSTFFDSGALVKFYVTEPESAQTDALARSRRLPLPLTHLQEGEVRNALRLKCARGEITLTELGSFLRALDQDITSGRLARVAVDWPAVWRRTERLSAAHAQATFCRTLDILHVAAALELGAGELVSFDRRQRALAALAGLRVLPATRP